MITILKPAIQKVGWASAGLPQDQLLLQFLFFTFLLRKSSFLLFNVALIILDIDTTKDCMYQNSRSSREQGAKGMLPCKSPST